MRFVFFQSCYSFKWMWYETPATALAWSLGTLGMQHMFLFWLLGNWRWFRSGSRWSYVYFPLNKLEKAVSGSQKTLLKVMVPVKQAPEWIFPCHSDSTDSTSGTDLVPGKKPGIQALSTICWKWKYLHMVWLQGYSPFFDTTLQTNSW